MSQSKLGFLIATAFSNTTGENWYACRALPSGMNWAVRFKDGDREICCWRTENVKASHKEAETMAKHAGFAAWTLEERTSKVKIVAVIAREMPAPARTDSSLFVLESRKALFDLLMEATSHLTEQGQNARHFVLANMTDQELMLEAQTLSGGVVWRSYLEAQTVDQELEAFQP
jgi:hypothetical protein